MSIWIRATCTITCLSCWDFITCSCIGSLVCSMSWSVILPPGHRLWSCIDEYLLNCLLLSISTALTFDVLFLLDFCENQSARPASAPSSTLLRRADLTLDPARRSIYSLPVPTEKYFNFLVWQLRLSIVWLLPSHLSINSCICLLCQP